MNKKKFYLSLAISVFSLILVLFMGNVDSINKRTFSAKSYDTAYSIVFDESTNKIGNEPYVPLTFHSGSGVAKTGLNNSVNFDYLNFSNQTNVWQNIKVGGSFTNTQPITGMTKMRIAKTNSDAHLTLYWSNSQTFVESRSREFDPTSALIVETNFENYKPNYIKVVAEGNKNSAISSMLIEFDCSNHYPLLEAYSANETMGAVTGGGPYTAGSEVTLRALPNDGYQFIGWYQNNVLLSTELTYEITTSFETTKIEGRFSVISYNMVVISEDENKGIVSGTGRYDYGAEVTINAIAVDGHQFIGWYHGTQLISENLTHTFLMPYNDLTLTGKFVKIYKLDIININDNYGLVSGDGEYDYNTLVTLTATPHPNYFFENWYSEFGDEITNELTYSFLMPEHDLVLMANFIDHVPNLEVGKKLYFGVYPQTEVLDETLLATLNNESGILPTLTNAQAWTSYNFYVSGSNTTDYMWYQDISVGEDKYRGVYFTSYRPSITINPSSLENSKQDDNGYYVNTRYWFKFDILSWDVLALNDDEGPLLFSSRIIDSQEFYHSYDNRIINGETINPNNYKESNVQKWLNDNLLNTAFTITEQNFIKNINDYEETSGDGKLLLPSAPEILNPDYGFIDPTGFHESKQRLATDYAKAMGVYVHTSSGYSYWWLRSPYIYNPGYAFYVDILGGANFGGVVATSWGVLPALRLN